MRIVCPTCAAAYDVPAGVVAARRTLRCTRCGAEFPAMAEPALPAPPAQDGGEAEPIATVPPPTDVRVLPEDRPAEVAVPRRAGRLRKVSILAAWAVSLALLGSGVWAFTAKREAIVRAWPPSSRLYAVLGYDR